MISLRSKVRWWAIYSRGFVFILQIISNFIFDDHQPTDTFNWTKVDKEDSVETLLDKLVSLTTNGLIRWDAHHFLHISNNGYTYEHNLAFFPIYPLLVQSLASLAHWFVKDAEVISYISLLKISSVYVNFIGFVVATDVLYSLSRRILRDEYLAYKASLFFCLNPASIFFSAPYSETLFSLFTFSAMLNIEKGLGFWSGIFLGLASVTRANGVINAGFVIYKSMKIVSTETILYVRAKKSKDKKNKCPDQDPYEKVFQIVTKALLPGMLNIILCLGPFAAFQWFSYNTYCQMSFKDFDFPKAILKTAKENQFVMPGSSKSTWCSDDPPLAYNYVQTHYWKVGFMNYWENKQMPQFFLAAPAIGMCLWQLHLFYLANPKFTMRLGLVDNTHLGLPKPRDHEKTLTLALPRATFVYLVHAAFLSLFGLFFAHVQITTRLLCSSSPVLPWFAALLTTPSERSFVPIDVEKEKETNRSVLSKHWLKVESERNLETRHSTLLLTESMRETTISHWVKMYFLGYTLVGTMLFSNHYPWT